MVLWSDRESMLTRRQSAFRSSLLNAWCIIQESSDSVTVPLLGKSDMSAFNAAPTQTGGTDPMLPQTALPQTAATRPTFQPQLLIKTPRTTPRFPSSRSSAAPTSNAADATGASNLEPFGSSALDPTLQYNIAPPHAAAAECSDAADGSLEQQDTFTTHSGSGVAVARTFTFAPGAFSELDGPKPSEDEDAKSSHTVDTSVLGEGVASSVVMSRDDASRRSPDQYPVTPRSPHSPRSPQDVMGEEDTEHEQGLDDDRSTMISQPTDTQSMKSYYRVFGNRCVR